MFASIVGIVLKWLGGDFLSKVLSYLENKSNNDTERQRIQSVAQTQVITTGMSHQWFWIPWLIATVPMACWFGYGMVNTMFTSLPHVAEIPPGLMEWAKIAWSNVFYSGAGVASASLVSGALSKMFK